MTTTPTTRLNSFDPTIRSQALAELAAATTFPRPGPLYNMHCHSFFSYNADGWSPSRVAFECRRQGLGSAALCDFDVLDGLEEFLAAGRLLQLRTAVHLETRAFISERSTDDFSSPGEPGVTYIMGCGFTSIPNPDTPQATTLAELRSGAQQRNRALIARINRALPQIALNYKLDVMPLTPKGVATERHIISAYAAKALSTFPNHAERANFWVPLLKITAADYATLEADTPRLEEAIRSALAKRGGIGYQQPDANTFPPVEKFTSWVTSCGAIPTIAWLDGTSSGEDDCEELLDLMTSKGCAALNIIPDRNWNISDPESATHKREKLDQIVRAAAQRNLPINIGTEMNKGGLPFVDNTSTGYLSQYSHLFNTGTCIMIGHTLLARYADAPYLGARARAELPDIATRNTFYAAVGSLPPITNDYAESLLQAGPDKAYAILADTARRLTP